MKYVSTRGRAPVLGFEDVLLQGLARDGGLYLPEAWPQISTENIAAMAGRPYAEVAKTVLRPFAAEAIGESDFGEMIDAAYGSFEHNAVTPLVQIEPDHFILELFHGPTMAFKDVAMQLLARLMDNVLTKHGERATIIGATSGDTGGAAIEAFKGRKNTEVFILFPEGKVSDVQRRQMTTVDEAGVHPLAVKGNFDDCQALVKALFNDHGFRDEVQLSGVNSINWARIMAQVVYYFVAASNLGAPHRKLAFSVPTGNFGDIFAGHVARRMGLPIDLLIIATNRNDILTRCLETSRYETGEVFSTISPSMDIQVSSNFERLLFEAYERDGDRVQGLMEGLKQSGSFEISEQAMHSIRKEFKAMSCDEAATAGMINAVLADSGYLLDPHTAVGVYAAHRLRQEGRTLVTLATAHPAKFPDAVEAACGVRPELPQSQQGLMEKPERFKVIANDEKKLKELVRSVALGK